MYPATFYSVVDKMIFMLKPSQIGQNPGQM